MCPFILSDSPEGIPYSVGVALCAQGNGCQAAGQGPGVPSVRGRGVNPSLGLSGAAGLPGAPLRTTGEGFAERGSGSGLGGSLASSFPSKCFKRQKTRDKKRTAVWWYSQEALQIPPPRSCVSFSSLSGFP